MRLVVMGVSGSGKTSIGTAVASILDLPFIDGDSLHPASNVAKMSAGVGLEDEDRWPWLDRVAKLLAAREAVVACSALKRRYRERIARAAPSVVFVHLTGRRDLIESRVRLRDGHFMPTSLVASQTLEPLEPGERGVALPNVGRVEAVAQEIVDRLKADGAWRARAAEGTIDCHE